MSSPQHNRTAMETQRHRENVCRQGRPGSHEAYRETTEEHTLRIRRVHGDTALESCGEHGNGRKHRLRLDCLQHATRQAYDDGQCSSVEHGLCSFRIEREKSAVYSRASAVSAIPSNFYCRSHTKHWSGDSASHSTRDRDDYVSADGRTWMTRQRLEFESDTIHLRLRTAAQEGR